MIERKNGYRRIIEFRPAWDRTDPDPSKNYGISDVELVFLLAKGSQAVGFSLSTNWHLPSVFARRMDYIKRAIFSGKEQYLWETEAKEFIQEVWVYDTKHKFNKEDDWLNFEIGNDWKLLKTVFPVARSVGYYWIPNLEKLVWDMFLTKGEEALWYELEKIYLENFKKGII